MLQYLQSLEHFAKWPLTLIIIGVTPDLAGLTAV